jgi:hypothetical protein
MSTFLKVFLICYEGFTVAPSTKSKQGIINNIQPWIDNIKDTWAVTLVRG